MKECFVIQPFDDDKFDKRFEDVFQPAVTNAGLKAYRVDKDPAINDLVAGIREGIDRSNVFLADLTIDNPNVWFELGYALAVKKPFCLVCSDERTGKYPFDISQLKIIRYQTGSSRDFTALELKITERLRAVVSQDTKLQAISPSAARIESQNGLDVFEQVALSLVFEEHLNDGLSSYGVEQKMERAGFNKTAAVLALIKLKRKELIEIKAEYDSDREEGYRMVNATEKGLDWIESNQDKLVLQIDRNPRGTGKELDDDGPPF